jgi:hypothetical protein
VGEVSARIGGGWRAVGFKGLVGVAVAAPDAAACRPKDRLGHLRLTDCTPRLRKVIEG